MELVVCQMSLEGLNVSEVQVGSTDSALDLHPSGSQLENMEFRMILLELSDSFFQVRPSIIFGHL